MNIFFLDKDHQKAAEYLCNRHVVKMTLETAQILSTVVNEKNLTFYPVYKSTHKNHPCVKWANESYCNAMWLVNHGLSIADEYQNRYKKEHKSEEVITRCFQNLACTKKSDWHSIHMTNPPQCMPEKYQQKDTVQAYRDYYIGEKSSFAVWPEGKTPYWWPKNKRS